MDGELRAGGSPQQPPTEPNLTAVEQQGRPDIATTMRATMDKLIAVNDEKYGGRLLAHFDEDPNGSSEFLMFRRAVSGEKVREHSMSEFLIVSPNGFKIVSADQYLDDPPFEGPSAEAIGDYIDAKINGEKDFPTMELKSEGNDDVLIVGHIGTLVAKDVNDPARVKEIVKLNIDRANEKAERKGQERKEQDSKTNGTLEAASKIDELLG